MSENEKRIAAAEQTADETSQNAVTAEDEFMPVVIGDEDFDANDEQYAAMLETKHNNIAAGIEEQPRYVKPKLPFKEAVANFFYHNKSKLLVALVILVMGGIIMYESRPVYYDYTFLIFSGNYYFDTEALDAISDNLEQFGEDLDGDGEVKVHSLWYNTFNSDMNELMVARVYMAEEFRTQHEAYLVLTDQGHYNALIDEEDGFGDVLFEEWKGHEKWIDVTDTGLFTELDGVYPTTTGDNTVGLSLVVLDEKSAGKPVLAERRANAEKMLDRILEKYPELN